MQPRVPIKGLICPLVTPLTADDQLDRTGFVRLLSHVSPHVDAVLVGDACWGEGAVLSNAMKELLIRSTWEIIDRPIPIYLGITGRTPEEVTALVEWIEAERKRYAPPNPLALVDYPLWYHSNRGLPQFLSGLLQRTDLPLFLANDPTFIEKRKRPGRHKNLRTAVLKKIGRLPQVAGMIYRNGSERLFHYRAAVGRTSPFIFYDGDEQIFLSSPGRWGVSAPTANIFPRQWRLVTRVALSSGGGEEIGEADRNEAWKLLHTLARLQEVVRHHDVRTLKSILWKRGILASDFATPFFSIPHPSRLKRMEQALGNDFHGNRESPRKEG